MLNKFLRSIKQDPSRVSFEEMANTVTIHSQSYDNLLQVRFFFLFRNRFLPQFLNFVAAWKCTRSTVLFRRTALLHLVQSRFPLIAVICNLPLLITRRRDNYSGLCCDNFSTPR